MSSATSTTTEPSSSSDACTPPMERTTSVRFDEACVLIPESCRLNPRKGILTLNTRPKMIKKSFTLPAIWPSTSSTTEADEKERGKKLVIPMPSLSPPGSKHRPPSSSVSVDTLTSCLRTSRSHDRGHTDPHHHHRSVSPTSPSHSVKRPRSGSLPASTIPLRTCCKACMPIVDAFLAHPNGKETMTRGAKRLFRSDSKGSVDTVMVDEIAKLRGEARNRSVFDDSAVLEEDEEEGTVESQTACGKDSSDNEDDDLFPLPSPRSSPRNSPFTSPANSQSSLALPSCANGGRVSPKYKPPSPLSSCISDLPSHPPCPNTSLAEELEAIAFAPSRCSSDTSPKPSRPRLASIGESFTKTSASFFKGMSGVSGAFVST